MVTVIGQVQRPHTGHHSCHASFWKKLSKKVKLDPSKKSGQMVYASLVVNIVVSEVLNVQRFRFDMGAYVAQVVSTCCKLTGTPISQLKRLSTPSFPETSMTGAELDHEGTLSGVASRVLMRGVWHCRLARLGISFFSSPRRWPVVEVWGTNSCIGVCVTFTISGTRFWRVGLLTDVKMKHC